MSVLRLLNLLEPRFGVAATRDLPYGNGERGFLDVHAPKGGAGRPVVVFFYGGGWDSGARSDYRWVGAALAAKGYVVVTPDYRLHPHARWPDFLEDCAKAVRWAHDNVERFGGDPGRMVLMGQSAGAYNAAMLAIDRRWLGAEGLKPEGLRGWIGLSGPYDFLPFKTDKMKAIFGPDEQHPHTQPINFVVGGEPPALLITGDRDEVVRPGNTDRLAHPVSKAG
jgi:acetyl esterase/lipase